MVKSRLRLVVLLVAMAVLALVLAKAGLGGHHFGWFRGKHFGW